VLNSASTSYVLLLCQPLQRSTVIHVYATIIYCGVDLLNCNNLLMPTWSFISKRAARLK
jgi:hypothetical protein